jgi:FtsP/CotA-like multicopper oxidase with cupredoxin domain
MPLSRRSIMLTAAAAGMATIGGGSRAGGAGTDIPLLRATTRALDINGRAATVLGLVRENGGHGIMLPPGERFRVRLLNGLAEPTIIHWHGQTPPVEQDGVPDAPLPMLAPGAQRDYDFAPNAGTHWMHAHVPDQEMRLLAAPLIVRTAQDIRADRQEVVLMLHDYSFAPLGAHLARLDGGGAGHGAGGGHGAAGHSGPAAAAMDLNDIDFDAYLANDRTLTDPEVIRVEPGGRVLLRIINGASATVFWIDTDALQGAVVAVDGHAVEPKAQGRFGLSMGQRVDIQLEIPRGGGAFPILALREGARERTGLVLATARAAIARIPLLAEAASAPFDGAQELRLHAGSPLLAKHPDRALRVTLNGGMAPYSWSIDSRPWGRHRILEVGKGERIELTMENASMMAHPMHLHGHVFQVVGFGSQRYAGAVRDTIHVPAMGRVTIALDAENAGQWMFHCHHMPHLASGMMTEVRYIG